jgi:hypothetical protein
MVAGWLAAMFSVFFKAMKIPLELKFHPIKFVTVRLRLSLMPVVAVFDSFARAQGDRPWRKICCLLNRCRGREI